MSEKSNDQQTAKLCLLLVMHKLSVPLPRPKLESIVAQHSRLHYFDVSIAFHELLESKLILEEKTTIGKCYSILTDGVSVIQSMEDTIPTFIRKRLLTYLEDNSKQIRLSSDTGSSYRRIAENQYLAELWITENNVEIMRIQLNVPTDTEAKNMCENWQDNAPTLFATIFTTLAPIKKDNDAK